MNDALQNRRTAERASPPAALAPLREPRPGGGAAQLNPGGKAAQTNSAGKAAQTNPAGGAAQTTRRPVECGDLPFLIKRDGTWLYRG